MNQKQKLKKYSLYEKFKCQNLKNTRIKTFITVIIYYHYMFCKENVHYIFKFLKFSI